MSYTRYLVLLTVAALTACGATGPQFRPELIQVDQQTSKIIVYRLSQFTGKGYTADIVLDGKPMGRLKDGGYIDSLVSPGRHIVEIDKAFLESGGRYPTELHTVTGEAYFVRYDQSGTVAVFGATAVPVVNDAFTVVQEEQALRELRGLKESK
jgi:predicted small lipoprotein YifL